MGKPREAAGLPAKKIGLLHVARRQLGLSEADYRAILSRQGGCESAADLDEDGFERVMVYLNALGFRSTWTKRTFGNRRGMAKPSHVELIRKLWTEYHGADEKETALNAWLAKYQKVAALRFVTAEKVPGILAALRSMNHRKGSTLPEKAPGAACSSSERP